MKIHIFGASGSGVTTLGNALANQLNIPYFDSDHYFGKPPIHPLRKDANLLNVINWYKQHYSNRKIGP